MRGGVKMLLATAGLAVAGCAAESGEVKIRAIADPAAKVRSGTIADAKGQLALGNAGLALEGFRKALREDPNSVEAYAGIAACYDSMGRYDLAGQNYQAALALAPKDPALLAALATSLERQGDRQGAAEVRGEIAQLASASAALDHAASGPDEPAEAVPAARSVTIALPPPRPVPEKAMPAPSPARSVTVSLPPARPVSKLTGATMLAAREVNLPETAPQLPVLPPARMPAPKATESAIVDVRSMPLRPAVSNLTEYTKTDVQFPEVRMPSPRELLAAVTNLQAPRLERLSPGEVALVTSIPIWRSDADTRRRPTAQPALAQSVPVRWVPITSVASRPNIRLLNAARRQGLAARSRSYLVDRGWRRIEIGDAAQTRDHSLILFPSGREIAARRLGAQFGVANIRVSRGNQFVVLLGRDAAALKAILRRA